MLLKNGNIIKSWHNLSESTGLVVLGRIFIPNGTKKIILKERNFFSRVSNVKVLSLKLIKHTFSYKIIPHKFY